jgi:hypothetical protein
MFNIPTWLSNVLFMATIYISGFQHVQLKRRNPIMNLQFFMIVFSLAMMLVGAVWNRPPKNPWVSLVLFIFAVGSLGLMIRRFRTLPPMRTIE